MPNYSLKGLETVSDNEDKEGQQQRTVRAFVSSSSDAVAPWAEANKIQFYSNWRRFARVWEDFTVNLNVYNSCV